MISERKTREKAGDKFPFQYWLIWMCFILLFSGIIAERSIGSDQTETEIGQRSGQKAPHLDKYTSLLKKKLKEQAFFIRAKAKDM